MKTKDLIKALLDFPIDSEVHVAGFDGATGERNWDGAVETVRYEFPGQVFIEFNELFLDNHEDEKNITPTGGTMIRADRLREGDVINTEPIFDYFERNGMKFNEADRMAAEAEYEIVESVTDAGQGYASVIVTDSVFYCVPNDYEVEVTNL